MPFKNEHPYYRVWTNMRQRCRNPKHPQWPLYGGRGISVCSRWNDFPTFVRDMGPRPKGYAIDRINNDGDYTPENCRWVTHKENCRNQRQTRFVTIDGVRYCAAALSEKSGIKTDTIVERAKAGLSYIEVMDPAPRSHSVGIDKAIKASAARRRAATHCKHGHEFTPENTGLQNGGFRFCKTCARLKVKRHRDRKRAAR